MMDYSVRTRSLRVSLLRSVIAIVLLLSAAILATTFFGVKAHMLRMSEMLTKQALSHTEAELQTFFTPINRGLKMVRAWANEGLIGIDDPEDLEQLFRPFLQRFPQISSGLFATSDGQEFMLFHSGSDWHIRLTDVSKWGAKKKWIEWKEGDEARAESWREIDYDPRDRPWFTGALDIEKGVAEISEGDSSVNGEDRSGVFWTEPYLFFTTKKPGITAAVGSHDADTGVDIVIGFDVLLDAVSEYTTKLHVGDAGMVFICTGDDRVLGLPSDERFGDPDVVNACLLKRPDELQIPAISDGAAAFAKVSGDGLAEPIRFLSSGSAWWGEYRPFRIGSARSLRIGVLIPEKELLGNLTVLRRYIIIITLAALIIAVIQAVILSERFSKPIEQLVAATDRIRGGDFEMEHDHIETSVSEVKRLAQAVERMRQGLRSLFMIERELDTARDIQRSTLPARLPDVGGFDLAALSESAEQTGGDTYDVVGIHREGEGDQAHFVLCDRGCERIVFLVADATGHGIGPALSAVQVRSMFRPAIRMGKTLGETVALINAQLTEDLPAGHFVTAWFGELDTATGELTTLSAGQGPMLYFDSLKGEVESYGADMLPMGIKGVRIEDEVPLHHYEMKPGDIYGVLSDGFFESMNDSGEQFGNDRIAALMVRHKDEPTKMILQAVCKAVAEFTNDHPAADDRTAVIIKRTG